MEGRRILLVLAIVLLMTAAAGSLVQVPEDTDAPEDATTERRQPPESSDGGATSVPEETREVTFRAAGRPSSRAVPLQAHVIIRVEAHEPGEVELEGLDRLEPVEPRTPAVFDLFTDRAGSFELLYTPVEGDTKRIGTLTVERRPSGGEPRGEDTAPAPGLPSAASRRRAPRRA